MNFLAGNRTYILAAIAIGYVIGGKAGYWPVDQEIVSSILAAGLAFLRAGVKAAETVVKRASDE